MVNVTRIERENFRVPCENLSEMRTKPIKCKSMPYIEFGIQFWVFLLVEGKQCSSCHCQGTKFNHFINGDIVFDAVNNNY